MSGGALHGLVVGVLLFVAGLAILRRVERPDDPGVARVIRLGLLLKLLAAPAQLYFAHRVYENIADFNLYHAEGARLAEQFRAGDFSAELPHQVIGLGVIYIVTGVVYALVGVSKTAGALVFAWIGFWGLYLLYRAARAGLPDIDRSRYSKLLFLLPSLVFWSSTIGKDSLMCFALGVAALGASRFFDGRRGGITLLASGLAMAVFIRPHVALILFVAVAIASVVRRPEARRAQPLLRALSLVVLVVGGAVLANRVEDYFGLQDLSPGAVEQTLGETAIETGEDSPFADEEEGGYGSSFDSTSLRSPLLFPAAVVTVLYRPFPFEAHNGPSLLASLEGSFLLLLTIVSLPRLREAVRRWRRYPYVTVAIIHSAIFCYLFASIGNFGILARQRIQVFPFVLVLLAVPAASRVERGSRRRAHTVR